MKKNKRQKNIAAKAKTERNKQQQTKNVSKNNFPKKAFIIAAGIFTVNFFTIPEKTELLFLNIPSYIFYILNIFFSIIIFLSLTGKIYSKNLAKYSFLIVLLTSIVFGFFHISKDTPPDLTDLYLQFLSIFNYLIIPGSTVGIIALWLNKERINKIIYKLFDGKHPEIKLFSKDEIPYTIAFATIIIMSGFTLFYRLDYFDLYSDEAQVTQGAAGYLYSGDYYQYNFAGKKLSTHKHYNRAKPHQWVVAQSYKIFGISNWSSRFPSALFGLILVVSVYFLARYFIRDKLTALLIAFSLVFFYETLHLQRWTRLYAMLIPLFFWASYYAHRFINEKTEFLSLNKEKYYLLAEYLNFNFKLLPVLLILIYLNFKLFTNSLFLLLATYLYIGIAYLLFREKKFLIAIILGVFFAVAGYYFAPNVKGFVNYIQFFKPGQKEIYANFFFGYPLGLVSGYILSIIGLSALFLLKDKSFKENYLFLLINVFIGWCIFGCMFDYPASFRYMSFISPLAITLLSGVFVLIIKSLYHKYLQVFLLTLFILSVGIQFAYKYRDLYIKNPESPVDLKTAWKTITDNYKTGEVIYRHWGAGYYMKDIDSTAIFKSLGGYEGKPFREIYDTLKNYKAGWLTWHSFNSWRMDPKLVEYTNLYFKKLHGTGIDATNVEVFYYTDSMMADTNRFLYERLFPNANLNLKNTFTFSFWINVKTISKEIPLLFLDADKNILQIYTENNSLTIDYDSSQIVIPGISGNEWHFITFIQNSDKKSYAVYIDNRFVESKIFNPETKPVVKFKVNTAFKGQLDDIRIYDKALSGKEIQAVMNSRNLDNSEELWIEGKPLRTLFAWKRK